MSTDLERALRTSASDLTLDRPAGDIIARGDRIRRRRRRGVAAGAAVAALGMVAALPSGSNPVIGPAVASWSGPETNLTPDQLQAVTEACRTAYTGEAGDGGVEGRPLWELPSGSVPVAAELRDDLVLAYFHEADRAGNCVLELRAGGSFTPTGLTAGTWKPLPDGRHLEFDTLGARDKGEVGGPMSEVHAVIRVSPDVSRVTLGVGGATFEASVIEELAFFWVADGISQSELDQAVLTAYDSTGQALERRDLSRAQG